MLLTVKRGDVKNGKTQNPYLIFREIYAKIRLYWNGHYGACLCVATRDTRRYYT